MPQEWTAPIICAWPRISLRAGSAPQGLPRGIADLAYLPNLSAVEGRGYAPPDASAPLFAVGGEIGLGKILVLADHSIFINSVMAPMETNNVEFTQILLRWLSETQDKRHRGTAAPLHR